MLYCGLCHTHDKRPPFINDDKAELQQPVKMLVDTNEIAVRRTVTTVVAGVPEVPLYRLAQSVLNAAVRLVFSARRFDHTTPLFCELH